MADFDPFHAYRGLLTIFVSAFTLISLAQLGWSWLGDVRGAGRRERVAWRYAVVVLLRIKLRRFAPDLLQIAALLALLGYLVRRH